MCYNKDVESWVREHLENNKLRIGVEVSLKKLLSTVQVNRLQNKQTETLRGYDQKQWALDDRNYAEHCAETYSLKIVRNIFKNLLTNT